MSKKRAFVRYTKSGEIVPGSLIITTNGGYPDKSSIWKEIQTNECCDGGECVGLYAVALKFDGPGINGKAYYTDRDLQNIPGQCGDPSLAIGAKLYLDPQGTTIVPDGLYFSLVFQDDSLIYIVENGIITSASCPA